MLAWQICSRAEQEAACGSSRRLRQSSTAGYIQSQDRELLSRIARTQPSSARRSPCPMAPPPSLTAHTRVAMTLDIVPELAAEYIAAHASPRPAVVSALRSVGLRNLSLWTKGGRLFYYAEFVPVRDETFDEAMARYAEMPGGTWCGDGRRLRTRARGGRTAGARRLTRGGFFTLLPLWWPSQGVGGGDAQVPEARTRHRRICVCVVAGDGQRVLPVIKKDSQQATSSFLFTTEPNSPPVLKTSAPRP